MKYEITLVKSLIARKPNQVATVKALLDVNNIPNPKAGDVTLKDVPLVAYDADGKILDVEIVPKSVSAKITITSPSKEVPVKVIPTGELEFGKAIDNITTEGLLGSPAKFKNGMNRKVVLSGDVMFDNSMYFANIASCIFSLKLI